MLDNVKISGLLKLRNPFNKIRILRRHGLVLSLFMAAVLLYSTSCSYTGGSWTSALNDIAPEPRWTPLRIEAAPFVLLARLRKNSGENDTLVVYLEGDGRAWARRGVISNDPTPTRPMALELAAAQKGGAAAYLARPCQYVMTDACDKRHWTSHRYSQGAVQSMDAAVDRLKALAGASRLVLVGYSGGGTMAALLAARRDDVSRLATAAANLDHAAWTRHHEVSPLTGSLNPVDAGSRLAAIPQVHFVGEDDDVVPPLVAESFVRRLGASESIRVKTIPGFDHKCCWVRDWPDLFSAPGGG